MPVSGRRKVDNDDTQRAADALAAIPPGAHVILGASATVPSAHPVLRLARERGTAQEFPKMRFGDIDRWVERRAQEVGLKTRPGALKLLTESVGDDLRLLDSELEKLELYAAGNPIGVEEVRALVPDSADHQIWDLTDALLVDPGRAALELERALASDEPAGRLSFMLIRHIRLVLAASDAPPGPAGIKALSDALSGDGRPISEYSARKAQTQARTIARERLEALFRRAAAVEAASRRGEIRDEDALRLLVLGVGSA
jgi:DNA polymerase-3 subunit delta